MDIKKMNNIKTSYYRKKLRTSYEKKIKNFSKTVLN